MNNTNPAVIPMLMYEDGIAAMDWLCRVFGFIEKLRWLDDEGQLSHGEITLNGGIIMLSSAVPSYKSPKHHRQICQPTAKWLEVSYVINGVLVYITDVQKHYQKVLENEATVLSHPEAGFPGLRYSVEDLEGQRWMFMQKNEEE